MKVKEITKKESKEICGGSILPPATGQFMLAIRVGKFIMDTIKNTGTDPL